MLLWFRFRHFPADPLSMLSAPTVTLGRRAADDVGLLLGAPVHGHAWQPHVHGFHGPDHPEEHPGRRHQRQARHVLPRCAVVGVASGLHVQRLSTSAPWDVVHPRQMPPRGLLCMAAGHITFLSVPITRSASWDSGSACHAPSGMQGRDSCCCHSLPALTRTIASRSQPDVRCQGPSSLLA